MADDSVEVIYDGAPDDPKLDDGAPAGHNARMADVADGKETITREAPPEWLPEKYARWDDSGKILLADSAQELAKANAELNKKFTQQQQTPKPKTDTPAPVEPAADAADNDVKAVLGAELFTELQAEYDKAGDLSAESRQKLAQLGFPDEVVDSYLSGREAAGQLYRGQIYESVGGEQEYNALIDWASTNLTKQQADFINSGLKSGNIEQARTAVRSLATMYQSAEGTGGDLMSGDGPKTAGVGFRSRAEMTAAMRDPRYATDDAYRADVINKVRWANF